MPFWAVWPFEIILLARHHAGAFTDLSDEEGNAPADAINRITARYDNVFGMPFPYAMGFHQRPTDGAPHREWHFHAHFYPPLLRSATVRKFMVGYEMLATPQRDITPGKCRRKIARIERRCARRAAGALSSKLARSERRS